MNTPIILTKREVRQLTLHAQAFATKKSYLEIIEQISYVQIDTISVTERAHNHVMYTRNPQFNPKALDLLMKDKLIFEYWSHAAAYLPMKDYSFSLYTKALYKKGGKHWFPRDKKVEDYVLDRIRAEGPLQSKDFVSKEIKKHAWGLLKPTKMAMTNLFMDGTIMIDHRKAFQKVFDLAERVAPEHSNTTIPTAKAFCRHLIENAISAHGFVSLQEMIYLRKGVKALVVALVKEMLEAKELFAIRIEGLETVYYSNTKQLNLLQQQSEMWQKLSILNPFDNLVIQRKRLESIFDFQYQIECYVPEKKRQFGYYTLPILYGDQFVGRLDAKADRKKDTFHVKGLWFEEGFQINSEFKELFVQQLNLFAKFCGCNKLNAKQKIFKTVY